MKTFLLFMCLPFLLAFSSDQRSIDQEGHSHLSVGISTNTSTASSTATFIHYIFIEVAGTTSTVAIYDDATAPCGDNLILSLPTITAGVSYAIHTKLMNGGCLLTAGGAAATLRVFYSEH
jgi:hypothetical protein